jgi:hypothetical protein
MAEFELVTKNKALAANNEVKSRFCRRKWQDLPALLLNQSKIRRFQFLYTYFPHCSMA